MARFYGEIDGSARTSASRGGNERSGLTGHIRGWHVGAEVSMSADGEYDICNVYATGGSAGYGRTLLGELKTSPEGIVFSPSRALRDAIIRGEGIRTPLNDIPVSVVIR